MRAVALVRSNEGGYRYWILVCASIGVVAVAATGERLGDGTEINRSAEI